jgi:hypothetical protein
MRNGNIDKPLVPRRFIVGLLGCLGCCLLYVLRSNLSVAIIAMVDEIEVTEEDNTIQDTDLCYDIHNRINASNSGPIYHVNIDS